MDADVTDRDAIGAATASLVETQAQIQRLLSVELEVASDQDLLEVGFRVQLSADAISTLLTLHGYGTESRG